MKPYDMDFQFRGNAERRIKWKSLEKQVRTSNIQAISKQIRIATGMHGYKQLLGHPCLERAFMSVSDNKGA